MNLSAEVVGAGWAEGAPGLLVGEKAHTREGDALAAARRRLPMVELDGRVEVVGADGPVPFLELFQGRDELVVYQHMWYDGAPTRASARAARPRPGTHLKDAVYLNARGVLFAILTTGRWDEVAPYVEFMGYTQPGTRCGAWRRRSAERGADRLFPGRRRPRVPHLLRHGPGQRAGQRVLGLLDLTPYGRREAWEDNPEGWPEALRPTRRSVGMAGRSAGTGARTPTGMPPGARPAGPCRSGPAPARSRWRPWAGTATTTEGPWSTASARL